MDDVIDDNSPHDTLISSEMHPDLILTDEDRLLLDLMPDVSEGDLHPLESVDPSIKVEIITRCAENPYFFAHFCRAPSAEGYVAIKPYGKQKHIINEYIVSKYVIILGSRQTGKTTITYTFLIWLMIYHENYKIGMLMQKDEVVKGAIAEVFQIYELLPSWLKLGFKVDNTKEKILNNGSRFQGFTVDPKNPDGVGRSLKVDFLLIDEAAFIHNIDIAYRALKPVTSRRHLRLKKYGIPYGISIITTPNGMLGVGRWFYLFWTSAIIGANNFKPVRFHWTEVPEYNQEWFDDATSDMTTRDINQEYELKFLGSQSAFLDDDIIERLQDEENIVNPINSIRLANASIALFEDIDENDVYILGADSADSGADYAAMILYNYTKGCVAGIYYEQDISALEFVDDVYTMMNLIPNMLLAFEKNSLGTTSIQLLYQEFGGNRIFTHDQYRRTSDEYKKCGISTNSHTRKLMIDLIYQYAKNNYDSIKSIILIHELIGLEQKGKRVEASKSLHDDASMAWSFILYIIEYGKISDYIDLLSKENQGNYSENMKLISQLNENKHVPMSSGVSLMNNTIMNNTPTETVTYENPVLNLISNNTNDVNTDDIEKRSAFDEIFGVS